MAPSMVRKNGCASFADFHFSPVRQSDPRPRPPPRYSPRPPRLGVSVRFGFDVKMISVPHFWFSGSTTDELAPHIFGSRLMIERFGIRGLLMGSGEARLRTVCRRVQFFIGVFSLKNIIGIRQQSWCI